MTSYNSACKINTILFLPRVPVINLLPVGSKFTLQYLPHHWDNELDFVFSVLQVQCQTLSVEGGRGPLPERSNSPPSFQGEGFALLHSCCIVSCVCARVCMNAQRFLP